MFDIISKITAQNNVRPAAGHIGGNVTLQPSGLGDDPVASFACCFALSTSCVYPRATSNLLKSSRFSMDVVPTSTGWPFSANISGDYPPPRPVFSRWCGKFRLHSPSAPSTVVGTVTTSSL